MSLKNSKKSIDTENIKKNKKDVKLKNNDDIDVEKNSKKTIDTEKNTEKNDDDDENNVEKKNNNTNDHDNNNDNNQLSKIITSNIHNPYINTTLVCPVMLMPNQMDNKMYIHLKSNLKNKLESKCYKNYGFVDKIYSIEETSDGIIEAEDPTCSAKITVRFTCSLCLPVIGKEIICKIDRMNKALISAINGPIKAIITTDKINKENFFPDMNRNIRIKGNSEVLVPDMFIRVLVLSKSFGDYDKNILVIAYLQDIATQEQINQFYAKKNDNTMINDNLFE
jgi:DNA-directed RNA polymerase subunit E'/Rpb7